jgi:DNA-binding MarR family transcriptional regulator/GNAT superfamily N-acetyltransferase
VQTASDEQIKAVRRFNRFYTRQIGLLQEGLLDSPFTLAQARVLYELGTRTAPSAREIGDALGLDAGYLSRILQHFAAQGLLTRERNRDDARQFALSLTAAGKKAYRQLDRKSHRLTDGLLARLSPMERARLIAAMALVQRTLSEGCAPADARVTIRAAQMGDCGWAIEQHARVYAQEFGWNREFEALVASLFARFASESDPATERFWVAEIDGERVGCVFVVRSEAASTTAQLRCLLVTPEGRGHRLGRCLVATCIDFARSAGYRKLVLWTNHVLLAARRIYETSGFELVQESAHHSFGYDLVGQTWSLDLEQAPPAPTAAVDR